jgi:hypothetical protein
MDESVQLNLFIKLDQLKTQLKKHYEIEESEKLNFTKALLVSTSLLAVIQIFEIFSLF